MAGNSTETHGPDIGRQQLGAVYAKALLGATEKAGITDDVMAEFGQLIDDVLDRFPALENTLSSLRVSVAEKNELLDRVFGSCVSESLLSFLKVVGAHQRLNCLREIRRESLRQLNEKRGMVDVHVRTAVPVDQRLADQISEVMGQTLGRQVQLVPAIDPDLIGGLVIRVGDKVFDGSVTNQLRQLRAETLENTIQEMRNADERFVVAD